MSTITACVHRTAGAGPGSAHGDIEQRMSGYALGSGTITDTLGPDGKQVEALVLMREPALPGIEVTACPIQLLHLHLDGAAHPVVLCARAGEDRPRSATSATRRPTSRCARRSTGCTASTCASSWTRRRPRAPRRSSIRRAPSSGR